VPNQERLEAFKAVCRRHGLPVTVQRRVIYEFVSGRHDHPTADRVYEGVQGRIPGVSRMTVYRVLNVLVDLGVLKKVCSPNSSVRFDASMKRHDHLVCLHCDKLMDYEGQAIPDIKIPDTKSQAFEITDYSIQFRGICDACRKRPKHLRDDKRGSSIGGKRRKGRQQGAS
jgi:Fur family peroxide stress response transcriptional regulator